MSSEGTPQPQRVLVLCVDRDDDLGYKAGIRTPIVGRDPSVEAALKLALSDPEEADANTIFAAVRTVDLLRKRGYEAEVALLSGHHTDSIEADRRLREQASAVINSIRPSGVVFVSDGAEDERVLPIVQQLAPILSVQRVVIKHSGSIEESYEVFSRYLKMALEDPRYSKYIVGLPGVILAAIGILSLYGLQLFAWYTILILLGVAMVYKGFAVDDAIARMRRSPIFHVSIFTFTASAIIAIVGVVQAAFTVASIRPSSVPPKVALWQFASGVAVASALPYLWLSLGLYALVMTVYYAMRRSYKALRSLTALVTISLLYYPIMELALFVMNPSRPTSPILIALLASLSGLAALTYFVYKLVRSSSRGRGRAGVGRVQEAR